MRLFADTNITAPAVRALRAAGHDVVHSADWPADPGDAALLREAFDHGRVFVTKDHDIGTLVFRDGAPHAGILLIDDLGSAAEEAALLGRLCADHEAELTAGAFLRADGSGVQRGKP